VVVVDSTVWVHFLRTPATAIGHELARLLEAGEAAVVGVVLAEVLQGARDRRQFADLLARLVAQPFLEESKATWVKVAELAFQLRSQGRPAPVADVLIAALAIENGCGVYTLDQHFQRIPGVALHQAGG